MRDAERIRLAAAEVHAAFADLRDELAVHRAELDEAAREPMLTEEDKRQLQAVAQRGDMGREMQRFAEEAQRGEADWESFVRGRDGRRDLLESLVERAQERWGDEVTRSMAESEPPPDVDDPRPGRGFRR